MVENNRSFTSVIEWWVLQRLLWYFEKAEGAFSEFLYKNSVPFLLVQSGGFFSSRDNTSQPAKINLILSYSLIMVKNHP